MSKKITLGLLALLLCGAVGLGVSEAGVNVDTPRMGQVGLQFLSIGQGARAAGMGYAYTAVADDISTVFWNSAGLTKVENYEYTLNYTRWFVDSKVYTAALAKNTSFGCFAISLVSFAPQSFEETTTLAAQGTGRTMNPNDLAIGLAFARRLTDKFSFGVHFRYIQEDLVLNKLKSFDVDIGSTFHTGYRSIRLSMALRNLGPDATIVTSRYRIPLDFTLGGAMETYGEQGDPVYMTLAFDYLYNIEREDRYHVGGELWISNMLALRGGYRWKYYSDKGFTAGAGLKYPFGEGRDIRVDFAYAQSGRLFASPLRFSLGGTF